MGTIQAPPDAHRMAAIGAPQQGTAAAYCRLHVREKAVQLSAREKNGERCSRSHSPFHEARQRGDFIHL